MRTLLLTILGLFIFMTVFSIMLRLALKRPLKETICDWLMQFPWFLESIIDGTKFTNLQIQYE